MTTDISGLTGYTQSNTGSSNSSRQTLSADMNTFLTLLTTQLKYQDPLDPMDTAEFTNQLVQYSNVEQSIQTNEKLDTLLSLNIANLGAQAVSYIGKTVQVLGDVMPLENGKAKATYTLDKDVTSVIVTVKDMNGQGGLFRTGKNHRRYARIYLGRQRQQRQPAGRRRLSDFGLDQSSERRNQRQRYDHGFR